MPPAEIHGGVYTNAVPALAGRTSETRSEALQTLIEDVGGKGLTYDQVAPSIDARYGKGSANQLRGGDARLPVRYLPELGKQGVSFSTSDHPAREMIREGVAGTLARQFAQRGTAISREHVEAATDPVSRVYQLGASVGGPAGQALYSVGDFLRDEEQNVAASARDVRDGLHRLGEVARGIAGFEPRGTPEDRARNTAGGTMRDTTAATLSLVYPLAAPVIAGLDGALGSRQAGHDRNRIIADGVLDASLTVAGMKVIGWGGAAARGAGRVLEQRAPLITNVARQIAQAATPAETEAASQSANAVSQGPLARISLTLSATSNQIKSASEEAARATRLAQYRINRGFSKMHDWADRQIAVRGAAQELAKPLVPSRSLAASPGKASLQNPDSLLPQHLDPEVTLAKRVPSFTGHGSSLLPEPIATGMAPADIKNLVARIFNDAAAYKGLGQKAFTAYDKLVQGVEAVQRAGQAVGSIVFVAGNAAVEYSRATGAVSFSALDPEGETSKQLNLPEKGEAGIIVDATALQKAGGPDVRVTIAWHEGVIPTLRVGHPEVAIGSYPIAGGNQRRNTDAKASPAEDELIWQEADFAMQIGNMDPKRGVLAYTTNQAQIGAGRIINVFSELEADRVVDDQGRGRLRADYNAPQYFQPVFGNLTFNATVGPWSVKLGTSQLYEHLPESLAAKVPGTTPLIDGTISLTKTPMTASERKRSWIPPNTVPTTSDNFRIFLNSSFRGQPVDVVVGHNAHADPGDIKRSYADALEFIRHLLGADDGKPKAPAKPDPRPSATP